MNEEMNNTFEGIENIEATEICNDLETSNDGLVGKIVVGAIIVAVGAAAAFVYKNRAKFEEQQIRRLEKKGYLISRPEDRVSEETESEDYDYAE